MWTPKLQNPLHKLKRFPKAKSLEPKVDSEENNLQNTHLSPILRHPNLKLANQKKILSLVWPRTKAQAILHLPHQWLMKCIKRHNKQLVAQHLQILQLKLILDYLLLIILYLHNKIWMKKPKPIFDHIFAGYNPSVLVDKTKSAIDGLKITHTESGLNEASRANNLLKKIKLEDLSEFLRDTRFAFFTPNSSQYEPIIVIDESEEEKADKEDIHDTFHDMLKDTSVPPPPSLKSAQIQELMAQVQLLQVSSYTNFSVFSSEKATDFGFPSKSIEQGYSNLGQEEKNTKDADTNLKDKLVDVLGKNVVTQYYTKKLIFDKYCDKMLKRKKSPKITNYEVLTKKGHIIINIYKEDMSNEVISNLKDKDLKISDEKTKSKDNDKGSRSKIIKHKGTSLQRRQRQRIQELNDKSILNELTKERHNEFTSGEIYISKHNPAQKKRVLGLDQLTEDPSSSRQKDLAFVKSSTDDTKVSILGVKRPWLSKAKGFILPNHDTADESSVGSTPLSPLKKLNGVEPTSEPKTIKSILSISFHIAFAISTQQGIYVVGSENRPPMLNKDNYVSWSSRLLRYAKSKPNKKLIYNAIMHDLYVRRMIPEPGDPDREVLIAETFLKPTDDELTDKENVGSQNGYNAVQTIKNQNRNGNFVVARAEGNGNGNGNNGNQFRKQSILGKPPSSSGPTLYSITLLSKSEVFLKVGESNALSKLITSNSAPSSRESTIVNNERVIALEIFRINPFKASKIDNFMPNKHVKASARTKLSLFYNLMSSLRKMVYFVEGLWHNLFLIGQFCDSDLKVAFRRNTCFVRNLERVNLLKGNCTTNLYTINIHEMASASPICLMARATSTKYWLWHQCLSHLNFDTTNDLAKNDLITNFLKFKYYKERLCPSREQGKSKKASHPPKPVPNSKHRLHLLHMDLCSLMRVKSVNRKCVGISHQVSSIRTPQQNRVVERRNHTKLDISFLYVFGDLCYPKNDREDIGKLGAKGDIGFFIGYSATSYAYRVYNRRTKKIMEMMNVTFDELSTMDFEQPPRTAPAASVNHNLPTPNA
nr:integrase, catalytic region, zinc finger, CCHC-type, peptidase aspartic, catalytic [Tanacetum cinerariifolium]